MISCSSFSKILGGGFRIGFVHSLNRALMQDMKMYGVAFAGNNSAHFHSILLKYLLKRKEAEACFMDRHLTMVWYMKYKITLYFCGEKLHSLSICNESIIARSE